MGTIPDMAITILVSEERVSGEGEGIPRGGVVLDTANTILGSKERVSGEGEGIPRGGGHTGYSYHPTGQQVESE